VGGLPAWCVVCNAYNEGIILYVMEVFNGSAVMRTVSIGALHHILLRLSVLVVGWGNALNCKTTLKSVWETEGTNILAT
jgi:hypothetical protein